MVEVISRPNVKVNFGTGHGFIAGGFMEELEVLKAHIGHFHMEDARTHGVSEHLPLGEGKVGWRSRSTLPIAGLRQRCKAAITYCDY